MYTVYYYLISAVPRSVSGLRVLNTTLTTITLEWTPGYSGGNNLEQNFWVAYREKNAADWEEEESVTQFYHKISGLQQDTTYEIRVTPENELGRGESRLTEGTTKGKH